MNAQKLLSVSAVVALVVAVGVSYAVTSMRPSTEVVREVVKELGALPGPDLNVPYLNINGVKEYYVSSRSVTGTTTPCSLRSPLSATSTLVSGYFFMTRATSSGTTLLTMARSVAPNSTTTQIGTLYTALASRDVHMWASTTDATTTPLLFPGGSYFIVGYDYRGAQKGSESDLTGPTDAGFCSAVFRVLDGN